MRVWQNFLAVKAASEATRRDQVVRKDELQQTPLTAGGVADPKHK